MSRMPEPPLDPPEPELVEVYPPRLTGPPWASPTDGSDRGWPDDRYIVAYEIEGVTEEDCRVPTLPEARARRYVLHGELSRKGHLNVKVVIWDAEDEARRDLAAEEAEDGTVGPKKKAGRTSVLTDEQRAEIGRRVEAGETVADMAREFGVTYGQAHYAAKRRKGDDDAEGD